MFTPDQIGTMDKSQVKAARGLGSLLSEEDKTGLDARWTALTAPPAPTPFPKQEELDEAYAQIKSWSDAAKGLIAEARQGNHTYHKADGAVVKPSKQRKAATNKTGKAQIVIGERVYTSWSKAADGENVRPDLSRDTARNWRPLVMDATTGTVKLTGVTVEEYLAAFPIGDGQDWSYEIA